MMSVCQPSLSKSLTSTPLKPRDAKLPRNQSVEDDSTSDSTYSLLSPIYHDSFDLSDDFSVDGQPDPLRGVSSNMSKLTLSESPSPGPPHRAEQLPCSGGAPGREPSSPAANLTAWEKWLIGKAREERVLLQQRAIEELTLREMQEEEERKREKKKKVTEGKIHEWLQMKREQEKQEKQSREQQRQKEQLQEKQKRLASEQKAQHRFSLWLRQKKQEELDRKRRESEEEARREEEERERRATAEERFKEWLSTVKDKGAQRRGSAGGYSNLSYPTPGFVNPHPWRPIHVPPITRTPAKTPVRRRPVGQPRPQSTLNYRPRDTLSFACKRRPCSLGPGGNR